MKSHSIKILILIIVCNIAALVGYYLLFQYIKTQSVLAASLSNVIDLGQQKNSHLNALRSVVKDTEGKYQQLVTLFLPSDLAISFIEQIETLGKNSGLVLKTNSISSAVDTDTAKIFQMQIETTGSWNNTMYFLNQLENLPYNIYVRGLSLSKQSGVNEKNSLWSAKFDISVTESI
jgi:Tfp pilus assembly protein PilO